jgi:hypothetical protein
MSHHHVLPPLLEFLPVKPKKIESRRRTRRVLVSSDGTIKDAGEAEEIDEMQDLGLSALFQPTPGKVAPVAERLKKRAKSTMGKLSDGTLKVLLLAQEDIK